MLAIYEVLTIIGRKRYLYKGIDNYINPLLEDPILPRAEPRPSKAPGLSVCEWSPEGLQDKSVSLIPNTEEILKLMKKK